MKFEIDFNEFNDPNNTPEFFEKIGAEIEYREYESNYYIELTSLYAMEDLFLKIESILGYNYSCIVGFDSPTIYLTNKV